MDSGLFLLRSSDGEKRRSPLHVQNFRPADGRGLKGAELREGLASIDSSPLRDWTLPSAPWVLMMP